MRWWISFEADEAPRAGTPIGDAIQALYTAVNAYGTWLEGEDAGIEPDRLIAYLEAWGEQMTTMKARTTASWAANTVARAVKDPGLLDQLPARTPDWVEKRVGECSWHPGEHHGICSEAAR